MRQSAFNLIIALPMILPLGQAAQAEPSASCSAAFEAIPPRSAGTRRVLQDVLFENLLSLKRKGFSREDLGLLIKKAAEGSLTIKDLQAAGISDEAIARLKKEQTLDLTIRDVAPAPSLSAEQLRDITQYVEEVAGELAISYVQKTFPPEAIENWQRAPEPMAHDPLTWSASGVSLYLPKLLESRFPGIEFEPMEADFFHESGLLVHLFVRIKGTDILIDPTYRQMFFKREKREYTMKTSVADFEKLPRVFVGRQVDYRILIASAGYNQTKTKAVPPRLLPLPKPTEHDRVQIMETSLPPAPDSARSSQETKPATINSKSFWQRIFRKRAE